MASSDASLIPRNVSGRNFRSLGAALRKSKKNLLLSCTYNLNASSTKQLHIGLRAALDGSFVPAVRLINNFGSGVVLTTAAWETLVSKFSEVDDYLDPDADEKPAKTRDNWFSGLRKDTIQLDGSTTMRFTTSHGSRVVAFYNGEDDDDEKGLSGEEEEEEDGDGPPAKRAKKYNPVILMQKVTFEGLRFIDMCVNEHIRRLKSVQENVDRCKMLLVQHLTTEVRGHYKQLPTTHSVVNIMSLAYLNLKQKVGEEMEDSFRQVYYDIVFWDMVTLFEKYVVADVRNTFSVEA